MTFILDLGYSMKILDVLGVLDKDSSVRDSTQEQGIEQLSCV